MVNESVESQELENDQVRIALMALKEIMTLYPFPHRNINPSMKILRKLHDAQSEVLAIDKEVILTEILNEEEMASFNLGKEHLDACVTVFERLAGPPS